jgi:DNA-binding XRE family transcriptional regulator
VETLETFSRTKLPAWQPLLCYANYSKNNLWGKGTMAEIAIKQGKSSRGLDLKIARIRAGLKQYELAARVGIAATQLCEVETGRREPSAELFEQILQAIAREAKDDSNG